MYSIDSLNILGLFCIMLKIFLNEYIAMLIKNNEIIRLRF